MNMANKKLILGSIAGDIIGSLFEFSNIKTVNFASNVMELTRTKGTSPTAVLRNLNGWMVSSYSS
jgi:hypothetical protein